MHLLCVMKYLQHIHEICVYITYINMKFVDSCNRQQVGMLCMSTLIQPNPTLPQIGDMHN